MGRIKSSFEEVLRTELREGKVAFLVGAGVSRPRPSNLPIGNELISFMVQELATRAGLDQTQQDRLVELTCSRLRLEVIFDVLYSEIGVRCFAPFKRLSQGSPNFIHYFLAAMLGCGNDVLTTNYDVQIERASLDLGVAISRVTSYRAFERAAIEHRQKGKLYKLHGSLKLNGDLPDRTSLIAAMRQVGRGLEESKAKVVERVLQEKRLVVLGYSGRDEFDIVPKLTGTRNVKYIHWIVHSNHKVPQPLASRAANDHVVQLLNKIDGPSEILLCDTQVFVKLLWLRKSSMRLRPSEPALKIRRPSKINLWQEVSRTTTLILIGDLLKRANAPKAADEAYKRVLIKSGASLEAKVILRRAQATLDLGNINIALPMIERSVVLATRAKDYTNVALAHNYLGILARKQSRWNQAVRHYRRALTTARRFEVAPEVVQNIYNNLGIALEKKGDYRSALKYLKRGLALARDFGDPESASKSLNNLGIAYDNLGKYHDAIESYLESLRLKELIGYRHGMAQTTHNLGLVYEHAGKLDLAFYWYGRSLALKRGITHDKHGVAQTQSNLGRLLRHKGKLRKARTLLQLAIRVLAQVGDNYGFAEALEELARVEIMSGKHRMAFVAANDAYKTYTNLGLKKDAERCRYLLAKTQQR